MKTRLLLAFIWVSVLWASPSWPASSFTDKYDDDIKHHVERWWPDFPFWKSWKAQLYQESRFDPEAISPVGARGLAQFMPATWQEVSQQLGYGIVSPHIAKYAIEAGAYYMAKQRKFWRKIDDLDRHQLAQASYNAGAGNISKAHKACNGADHWRVIAGCLPKITGKHSRETITYIERIQRYWDQLEVMK